MSLRIYVNPDLFREALKRGRYEYWTPFGDEEVGSEATLIEHVGRPGATILSTELDMVLVDVKRNKDGFWTVVYELMCGRMEL